MPPKSAAAVLVLTALCALAPALFATEAAPLADPMNRELSPGERLEALIERIKLEQRGVSTLEARFTQLRESNLLKESERSEGVFSYEAPDRVRWEYVEPNPISVVIDGREMITWYRDLGRAERYRVGRYSSQVFKYLGASGSMETLVDYFRVTVSFPPAEGGTYRLKLLPKFARIAAKLESMTLWIDGDRYFPSRLRYVSADGDVTDYRFRDFKFNAEIPADRFRLELPEEVDTRDLSFGQGAR